MIRIALEIVLLFLVPTAAYFAYALLARPGTLPSTVFNEAPFAALAIAGALLVGGLLVYYGWTSGEGGVDKTAPAHRIDGSATTGDSK
jgi:hypothetical protein